MKIIGILWLSRPFDRSTVALGKDTIIFKIFYCCYFSFLLSVTYCLQDFAN